MSGMAQQLAEAVVLAAGAQTGTTAGTPAVQRQPVRSKARVVRIALLVISVGSHAVAVFLIARLLWKLRKARQQQQSHRRAVRTRLIDRLQIDPETAPSSNSSSACSSPRQLELQLQALGAERDVLKQQVQTLTEEKSAIEASNKALEEELSQHTASVAALQQQNKSLSAENQHVKQIHDTLTQENEALRTEVGRLTELLEHLKKAQDSLRPTQFGVPPLAQFSQFASKSAPTSAPNTAPSSPPSTSTTTGFDQDSSVSLSINTASLESSTIDDDARSDTSSISGAPEFDGYSSASSSRSTSPRQYARRLRQAPIIGMPAFMRMHPTMMLGQQPLPPTQQH